MKKTETVTIEKYICDIGGCKKDVELCTETRQPKPTYCSICQRHLCKDHISITNIWFDIGDEDTDPVSYVMCTTCQKKVSAYKGGRKKLIDNIVDNAIIDGLREELKITKIFNLEEEGKVEELPPEAETLLQKVASNNKGKKE